MSDEPHTCPACDGTGRIVTWRNAIYDTTAVETWDSSYPCPRCGGTGKVVPYRGAEEVKQP